jgi:hypothetical protein
MSGLFQAKNHQLKCSSLFFSTSLAAVSGLMILGYASCVQAKDTGSLGGDGGQEWRSTCQPNDYLIGFNMRTGDDLDAIVPICNPINAEFNDWAGQAYEASNYWGGDGGEYQKVVCDAGSIVTHLIVHMSASKVVNRIGIGCQDLDSPTFADVYPPRIEGQSVGSVVFECEPGEAGVGAFGRSGALIDKMGLQCGPTRYPAAKPPIVAKVDQLPFPSVDESIPVGNAEDFSGSWTSQTDKGATINIKFTVEGNTVEGEFSDSQTNVYDGSLKGTVKNGVLKYESYQPGIDVKGHGKLTIRNNGTFDGGFSYMPKGAVIGDYSRWIGQKTGGSPVIKITPGEGKIGTVIQDVNVCETNEGCDDKDKIGDLKVKDKVTVLNLDNEGNCPDGWRHFKNGKFPDGWAFSGGDFVSIKF